MRHQFFIWTFILGFVNFAQAFDYINVGNISEIKEDSFLVVIYRPYDQLKRKYTIKSSGSPGFTLSRQEEKILQLTDNVFYIMVDAFGHKPANFEFKLEKDKIHYLRVQDRNNYSGTRAFLEVVEVSENTYRNDMSIKR